MSKPPKGWTDQWGPGDVRWTQDVPVSEVTFTAENEVGEKSVVEGDRVTLETAPYRTLDYIQTPEALAGYVEAEIEERIREGRLAIPPSPAPPREGALDERALEAVLRDYYSTETPVDENGIERAIRTYAHIAALPPSPAPEPVAYVPTYDLEVLKRPDAASCETRVYKDKRTNANFTPLYAALPPSAAPLMTADDIPGILREWDEEAAIPPSPAPPREGALDELKRRLDLVEEIACELVDSGTISEDDHERIMAATNGRAALPPSPAPGVHDPYRNLDVYERMAKGFEALGVLRKMWTAQEVANWIRGQTKAAPPSAPALPPSRAPEPVAWRMGSDDNGWIVYADKVAAEMEMGEGDVLIPLYAALPPSPTPSPVMLAPAGCVCPAGAEQTCNGAFCPRRAMKWTVT